MLRTFTHRTKEIIASTTNNSTLILLNWEFPRQPLEYLWSCVQLHICADGAANRLLKVNQDAAHQLLPDYVYGDLDSIHSTTQQFLEEQGVRVVQNTGQNSTDLDKCLNLVETLHNNNNNNNNHNTSSPPSNILVLGAFGGRLDHEMANMNSALRWCKEQGEEREHNASLTLLSEHSLAFVLSPGTHHIYPDFTLEGPTCGLIPLGTPCESITTTGLKWNLDNARLEFGSLISTSNAMENNVDKITVTTSHPILWRKSCLDESLGKRH